MTDAERKRNTEMCAVIVDPPQSIPHNAAAGVAEGVSSLCVCVSSVQGNSSGLSGGEGDEGDGGHALEDACSSTADRRPRRASEAAALCFLPSPPPLHNTVAAAVRQHNN